MLIVLVSLLIGAVILGGNYLNYDSQQVKYSITYDEDTKNTLTLKDDHPVRVAFQLEKPRSMQNIGVSVTFKEIHRTTKVTPVVNGKTFETGKNLVPGSTHTFNVDQKDLRKTNELRIEGKLPYSNEAYIQKITVTGVTNGQRMTFLLLNILGILIIIGPILVVKYRQYSKRHVLEEQFPNFLRDVVEGTRAGMSLPQSIQNTRNNNYSDLSPYVDEMGAKLEWGIPFETVMESFGRKTHSQIIQRSVSTIIQTYRAGGNVSSVLETIGSNLNEIRQLRKERESQVYGEMVTGYIVFFAFLLVLVVLVRYLLPALTFSNIGVDTGTAGLSSGDIVNNYRSVFQWLVAVQSIFSGLVIGRLSEGELKAGGKHILVLFGVGYVVALVFM